MNFILNFLNWLVLFIDLFEIIMCFQIAPEKPIQLRIRACTHKLKPFQLDTMLFFPSPIKFCISIETSKSVSTLARDTRRTTSIQSTVSTTLHKIGSPHRCHMDFMGYGGEYRISPDFGYYAYCQNSLSRYVNALINSSDTNSQPIWNISHPNCPIQNLPNNYWDLLSCNVNDAKWYELIFSSAIQYEIFRENFYHQFWANHSTTYIFKTEKYVERNGTELFWLQSLIELKTKLSKNCHNVRYFLKVDEDWPLPIMISITYQLRDNALLKNLRHVGNGTLEKWFSGIFPLWPTPNRTHEICVQLVWPGSQNRFRLCRVFAQRQTCNFKNNAALIISVSNSLLFSFVVSLPLLLLSTKFL